MKKIFSLMLAVMLITIASACNKDTSDSVIPTEILLLSPTSVLTSTPSTTDAPVCTEEVISTEAPVSTEEAEPVITPSPTPALEPIDLTQFTEMYVKSPWVNVRKGASTSTKKLTALPQNTVIKAYKDINGWYYVSYNENSFGFMRADLLTNEPVPTPVPTEAPITQMPVYKPNSNLDINDNVFLDALEYTGYNLKKHREDGNMWVFILGKYKEGLGYLSGLGYDYGKSTGYETNAQGMHDILRMKKNGGLVCASYLTYVYFNYLPNVAKIDTSHLTRPDYPCSAQSWRLAAEDWVAKGLSKKISFTATRHSSGTVSFNPSEPIPIGSIVVFKAYGNSDSAPARHVSIYAGHAGGYHWLTHVGNERGPEMITVENMGFGSTPELPLEVITPPISFQ